MKLEYFQEEWADKPEWITMARSEATVLWNEQYKAPDFTTPSDVPGYRYSLR